MRSRFEIVKEIFYLTISIMMAIVVIMFYLLWSVGKQVAESQLTLKVVKTIKGIRFVQVALVAVYCVGGLAYRLALLPLVIAVIAIFTQTQGWEPYAIGGVALLAAGYLLSQGSFEIHKIEEEESFGPPAEVFLVERSARKRGVRRGPRGPVPLQRSQMDRNSRRYVGINRNYRLRRPL